MTREASIKRRVADINGVVGQCRDCGRDMGSNRNKFGLLVHAGHGQCTSCRSAIDRAKKKAGELVAPVATLLPLAPAWMKNAPCASVDPEIFYPEKGESAKPAKSVCRLCPYKAPCLTYAVEHRQRFGVWGGLAEKERRGLDLFGDEERLDGAAA